MDNLYILIPTVNGLWQGWLVTEPNSSAQVLSQHELEAIMATKAMNMRITLLLPTSSCVIAAINVTRQQLKQLSATDIAYLLEDQTLTAVEQLHCVYEPLNEQQALVLGIQDNVLKRIN
jgi:type II secretory pathway component PulL